VTIGGAAVAAVVEQVLGLFGEGFDPVKLTQDVTRNGFIAGLFAFVTSRLTKQQEARLLRHSHSAHVLAQSRLIDLAVSGWSDLVDSEKKDGEVTERSLADLSKRAVTWRKHADKIGLEIERPVNEPSA
jgi:hypothetical protein